MVEPLDIRSVRPRACANGVLSVAGSTPAPAIPIHRRACGAAILWATHVSACCTAWVAFSSLGCVGGNRIGPTTQPIGDVEQLSGVVAAAVKAALTANVAVNTEATGIKSEFGFGSAIITGLALVLTIVLSHRREMVRLTTERLDKLIGKIGDKNNGGTT